MLYFYVWQEITAIKRAHANATPLALMSGFNALLPTRETANPNYRPTSLSAKYPIVLR